MTLRSDYLGELQQAPALTAPFEEFSLKPMPLARVRDIIEGPARVAGLTVDGALVAAAMNDAATDDALPLLAFALRELYDRFGQKRHLTLEAYPRARRRCRTTVAAGKRRAPQSRGSPCRRQACG